MEYLKVFEDNTFIITNNEVLYTNMISLPKEVSEMYKENTTKGKAYIINNCNGECFEEIFTEIEPIKNIEEPTLEERIKAMELALLEMM